MRAPPSTASQPRAVLQTYTVSLAEVKRDIDLWKASKDCKPWFSLEPFEG